jgi:TolB-like protein
MADVFISYAREDAAHAQRLADALAAAGYTAWWDRNLTSGARYLKETEAELGAARAVVVVWSKDSVESHWVADEAAMGRDDGRLAALSFDGSTPPLGFRQFQVTDFSGWKGKGDEPAFQSLLSALARLAPRAEGAPPPAAPAPVAPRPRISRSLMIGGAALAAALLAGVIGVAAMFARPPAAVAAAAPAYRSIAVLPFADHSAAGDQAYLAEGMAEAVLNLLARNRDLQVAARTSSFVLKGRSIADVASELHVDLVLDGSVQRDGDQVRIVPQLIDAKTGAILWTETYDRTLSGGGLFDAQDRISAAIALELRATIGGGPAPVVEARPSDAATDAFLEGRYLCARAGAEDIEKGIAAFERAIAADPGFAPAHALLASCNMQLATFGDQARWGRIDRAITEAERLGPNQPATLEARAAACFFRAQPECGIRANDRILELLPNSPTALARRAELLPQQARLREAVETVERVYQLDPFGVATNIASTPLLVFTGRAAEAERRVARAVELNPDEWFLEMRLSQAQMLLGRDTAYGHLARALEIAPSNITARTFAQSMAAVLGFPRDELLALSPTPLTDLFVRASLGERIKVSDLPAETYAGLDLVNQARLHLAAGDAEGARRRLERAYEADPRMGSISLTYPQETRIMLLGLRRAAGDAAGTAELAEDIKRTFAQIRAEGWSGPVAAFAEAQFAAARGDADVFFRIIDSDADAVRLSSLFGPLPDNLRTDGRFAALERRTLAARAQMRETAIRTGAYRRIEAVIRQNYLRR